MECGKKSALKNECFVGRHCVGAPVTSARGAHGVTPLHLLASFISVAVTRTDALLILSCGGLISR